MKSCKTCGHYGLYQMIKAGPYGYSGDIPCLRCVRLHQFEDEHTGGDIVGGASETVDCSGTVGPAIKINIVGPNWGDDK